MSFQGIKNTEFYDDFLKRNTGSSKNKNSNKQQNSYMNFSSMVQEKVSPKNTHVSEISTRKVNLINIRFFGQLKVI